MKCLPVQLFIISQFRQLRINLMDNVDKVFMEFTSSKRPINKFLRLMQLIFNSNNPSK